MPFKGLALHEASLWHGWPGPSKGSESIILSWEFKHLGRMTVFFECQRLIQVKSLREPRVITEMMQDDQASVLNLHPSGLQLPKQNKCQPVVTGPRVKEWSCVYPFLKTLSKSCVQSLCGPTFTSSSSGDRAYWAMVLRCFGGVEQGQILRRATMEENTKGYVAAIAAVSEVVPVLFSTIKKHCFVLTQLPKCLPCKHEDSGSDS